MTARMMTADAPMTTTTTKVDRVDTTADNAGMMAGADMYRRMQAKPKGSSSNGLLMGGVALVAIIAGGAYFATHNSHGGSNQRALMAANTAITSDQQAQASKAVAQSAQQSKQIANDEAQAKTVADTGNPPSATTDSTPVKTPARVEARHERSAPVVRHVIERQPAHNAADAASAAIDTSAVTAPPAPVTATPSTAAPATATPAPAAASPSAAAPVQTVPAAPTPAATPAPAPEQPAPAAQPTTPPQQ